MGKVRSKKCSKIARPDPTGLNKAENEEEEVNCDLGPVSAFVQTNLEQLRSHIAEERDSGLNALSNASSKPVYLEEILRSDIVKVVGPLLLDPSISVRHSAAGALRNLSSISMDVCDKIISADIMTPLVTLIKEKYSGNWVPLSKEKKSKHPLKIDSAAEAFIEAVTLLWNLCEAGETAVKIFNQEKLGDVLLRFLNVKTYGLRIALCSALCLFSATEDNTEAVSNQKEFEETISSVLLLSDEALEGWQLLYLQTTAVGILVNFYKGDLQKASPETINLIMGIINKSLEIDHVTEVNKFSSEVPVRNGDHAEVYHRETESDLKKIFELDDKCEGVKALISSQIMSLEIISNIIITDEDDNCDDEDESEESMSEDLEDGMENGEEDVEMKDITDIPEQVYESLSSTGVVSKVLSKIRSLPVNVGQILNEDEVHGQTIFRKYILLRSTALICLQNLMEVLRLDDLEKCISIVELWTGLGKTLTECGPSDETMVEAITSAMRALIQSIVSRKGLHPASVNLCGDFAVFNQVYESVSIMKVKVNVVKIIGCMGILLSRFPKDAPNRPDVDVLLTEIATYFLTCLSSTKLERQGLWLAAEVLDTIFDVFAEDDYNNVLKGTELIPKLRKLQPLFKKQVRNERRSLGENAAVIQTANTNLPRFIQYKEKHGAC